MKLLTIEVRPRKFGWTSQIVEDDRSPFIGAWWGLRRKDAARASQRYYKSCSPGSYGWSRAPLPVVTLDRHGRRR